MPRHTTEAKGTKCNKIVLMIDIEKKHCLILLGSMYRYVQYTGRLKTNNAFQLYISSNMKAIKMLLWL